MKSVLDFGAKGDGITDDSDAFQAALTNAKNISVPYSENGYVINKQLTLIENTSITGDSNTKLIHNGNTSLFDITGDNVSIQNFYIDSTNTEQIAKNSEIVLRNNERTLKNIKISDITLLNSNGLISDESDHVIFNLRIKNITAEKIKGSLISLSVVSAASIKNIIINYIESVAPDYAAITIAHTYNLYGGIFIDTVEIIGSDSELYSNQHGIVIGSGEHATISNVNILLMSGIGIYLKGAINLRLANCNVSFCTGNQIQCDMVSYSNISNCMTRGRANGTLKFLVTSTYGVELNQCVCLTFTGCDFKSNGAGVFQNESVSITYSGCAFSVNYYWGFVSYGLNTSLITGSQFLYNTQNVYHTSPTQYVLDSINDAGIFNLIGCKLSDENNKNLNEKNKNSELSVTAFQQTDSSQHQLFDRRLVQNNEKLRDDIKKIRELRLKFFEKEEMHNSEFKITEHKFRK